MSKKKEKEFNFDDSVINIRARLRELEACEYFLHYIAHVVSNGYGHDTELHEAIAKINYRLYRTKDHVWQQIACLSPICPALTKMLEDRLRHIVDSNTSLDDFLGQGWRYNATAEEDFKKHIKERLANALKVRPINVDTVEVPKRELSPEL